MFFSSVRFDLINFSLNTFPAASSRNNTFLLRVLQKHTFQFQQINSLVITQIPEYFFPLFHLKFFYIPGKKLDPDPRYLMNSTSTYIFQIRNFEKKKMREREKIS